MGCSLPSSAHPRWTTSRRHLCYVLALRVLQIGRTETQIRCAETKIRRCREATARQSIDWEAGGLPGIRAGPCWKRKVCQISKRRVTCR